MGGGWAAVALRHQHAFVVGENQGSLTVVDLSDPARPRIRAVLPLDGDYRASRIAVTDRGAWITSFQGGLGLVDVSDLDQPRQVASCRWPGGAVSWVAVRALAVDGDRAYLATDDALLWSVALSSSPCTGNCLYLPWMVAAERPGG